jgi:hypothetical protein
MNTPTSCGPGFARMQARLGPDRAEALRQDTLRRQEAALSEAATTRPAAEGDHGAYADYPAPARSPRGKRR